MLKVKKFQQPAANRFGTAGQKPVGGHKGLKVQEGGL